MSTSDPNKIHGHCSCGALQYTIDISSLDEVLTSAMYCHCAACQRLNGAPYIWSNHWLYKAVQWFPPSPSPPPGAPDAPEGGEGQGGSFSPNMATYEIMPGRKWKLRCRECGSPLGSWNAVKKKWTIWPTTWKRKQSSADGPSGVKAEGDFDVHEEAFEKLKASHHQFYGPWRSVTLRDGLPKWLGYAEQSQRVDDDGEPCC